MNIYPTEANTFLYALVVWVIPGGIYSMKEVWVEKYRPKALSDIVGQADIVERFNAYVATRNLPHLLFAGPPGTGKTTSAIVLARELFGENWQGNFHELNASDERGIKVVRTKIKDYARTAPLGGSGFKIIFLDEADALTTDAQAALRRTMEKFTKTCRFILSCNYSSKIMEPIQSRCAIFRFRPLKDAEVLSYLDKIAKAEGKSLTKEGAKAIFHISQGDLRKATNILQVAAFLSDEITADTLYKVSSTARPENVTSLLETAIKGNFNDARKLLDDMLIEYGLSGEDIIAQIHRSIVKLTIDDEIKVKLIDRIGEIEFRMVEGSNERIQLEALLAFFVLAGKDIA